MTTTRTRRLFCSKPFRWFEVSGWYQPKGDVFMCCPTWLDTPIGNIQTQTVNDIWNGKKAQEIRNSILDGSFKFCNHSRCPFLQTESSPVERVDEVKDPELRHIIDNRLTVLPYGPREINCAFDKSCNLACPSCRTEVIVERDDNNREQILRIRDKIRTEALKDADLLYITGSGDPFGSPFFREWLQTMKRDEMPKLKRIRLHTNAQMWTPKVWNSIPQEIREVITSTEISIDAATQETYAVNRRGGDFGKLLRNLEFISLLRHRGPLESVTISMVVQNNNFMEMPAFVQLGKGYAFDIVYFSRLVDWGTFAPEEFKRRAVHLPRHRRHAAFVEVLGQEIFRDPIVNLGNLSELLSANGAGSREASFLSRASDVIRRVKEFSVR